ncbi:solute carrier family 35 member G1-like [Exaiptasia diaphana]|uniref:EamA domain-containing protein n=1 Tax=Exaiptasia diaphana TaxID=2652724 RepID=A0A913YLN4_EXADI|nr:solute carrier family 35 member G1-like [Exaiptasia diaphana]
MERTQENDGSFLEPLACSTERTKSRNVFKQYCRSFVGVLLALLSALSVVIMNVFAKLCLILPPFEIGVIRFIVHLLLTTPPVIYTNHSLVYPPKVIALLVLRGFIGASGMFTRVYAVQNMPLGDAIVLIFTSPVFTAVLARIFLKERLHWIYSILLVLCMAGVTLIARPTFIFGHPDSAPEYDNVLIPTLVAWLSAVCSSCAMVTIRVLLRTYKVPSSVILLYFGLVGLVYSILGSYFDRGFQFPFCQSTDYLFAACVGVFAYLTQFFLNGALKYEKAFIVALSRSPGTIFGFIFQIIIYSLIPGALSFGGASLIILCNLFIFMLKWYQNKNRYGK